MVTEKVKESEKKNGICCLFCCWGGSWEKDSWKVRGLLSRCVFMHNKGKKLRTCLAVWKLKRKWKGKEEFWSSFVWFWFLLLKCCLIYWKPNRDRLCLAVIEFLFLVLAFVDEKEYYEKQFATLKSFQEVDTLMTTDTIDEEDDQGQAQAEKAMKISNYANILLLVFKVNSPMLVFEINRTWKKSFYFPTSIACSNVSYI